MEEKELKGSEVRKRTAVALLEFVERVTKESATPEELQALPSVARILVGIFIPD